MSRRAGIRLIGVLALAGLAGLLSGCAAMKVRAWDRDLMAEKKMRFIPHPGENDVDDHIYFSKEGSTGGLGVSGGGCGCN